MAGDGAMSTALAPASVAPMGGLQLSVLMPLEDHRGFAERAVRSLAEREAACDLLRRCGRCEIVPAASLAAASATIADRAPEVMVLDAALLSPSAPEQDLRRPQVRAGDGPDPRDGRSS